MGASTRTDNSILCKCVKVIVMIRIESIPDFAICPVCRQPMKVVFLGPIADKLGVKVPDESSFVFECCGDGELIIDCEETRQRLKDLLISYHSQK